MVLSNYFRSAFRFYEDGFIYSGRFTVRFLITLLCIFFTIMPKSANADSGWVMLHCVGNKTPVSKISEFEATNVFIKNDGSEMHMGNDKNIYQRVGSPINWVYEVDMETEDMTHFKEFNPNDLTLRETLRLKGAVVGNTSLVCQPVQNPFSNMQNVKE